MNVPGLTSGGKCTQWNFCNGASLVGKKRRWSGVVALVIGTVALIVTHQTEYQIAWVAFVVGVHFVGFGKLIEARYYPLGGALIVAALAGLVIGLTGGGTALTQAVTGLVAGVCMFGAAAQILLRREPQPA